MSNKTLAVTLANWEFLIANLELHQDELPGLQSSREELIAFVDAARATGAEQIEAEGAVSDIIARRRGVTRDGNHLQQYIAAVLRKELGPSSPRLLQFGVRPRALQRLPPTATPEIPDEEPGSPPAPPPSDS
jgi:hypothetical protein